MHYQMLRSCKNYFAAMALAAVVSGCVPVHQGPPPPPPKQSVSVQKPVMTSLAETKELQEKGGLQISVVPGPFTLIEDSRTEKRVISTGTQRTYGGGQVTDTPVQTVEITKTPLLRLSPDHVRFVVKINNKLQRVFRGDGMVVRFNVAGKEVPVDQHGYTDLVHVIVTPRGEEQVVIDGPMLANIPANSTIALNLYDVVIDADKAGNVAEKQNFEWLYSYSTQTVEREMPVVTEQQQEPTGPPVVVPPEPTRVRNGGGGGGGGKPHRN
jgi:hypothetical protein